MKKPSLTPAQKTARNTARKWEYRQRMDPGIAERRKAREQRDAQQNITPYYRLTADDKLKKLNQARSRAGYPDGSPTPPPRPESPEYLRLYNLARTKWDARGKDRPLSGPRTGQYVPRPNAKPRAKPHISKRFGQWLGRPIRERRWSVSQKLLPHIAIKVAAITRLLSAANPKTPSIPRGTLTQATLRTLLHYDPDTGNFQWLQGARTGDFAGFDHHANYPKKHIGRNHPPHDPLLLPTNGLTPQHKNARKPPKSYPGGHIVTGSHTHTASTPIDAQGRPLLLPCIRLPIHTLTDRFDPITGRILTHRTHDFHTVRPHLPERRIIVGGVSYPAWKLAILYRGAGTTFTMQYLGQTPVPHINPPENNTSLTFTRLDNKPAPPVFRDGNTLNLAWENINPLLPPIYPLDIDLHNAQRKFDATFRRKAKNNHIYNALTAENRRKYHSEQARKARIHKERCIENSINKYKSENCITKKAFNIMQNEWIVQIPHHKAHSFFSETEAIEYFTNVISKINVRKRARKARINKERGIKSSINP